MFFSKLDQPLAYGVSGLMTGLSFPYAAVGLPIAPALALGCVMGVSAKIISCRIATWLIYSKKLNSILPIFSAKGYSDRNVLIIQLSIHMLSTAFFMTVAAKTGLLAASLFNVPIIAGCGLALYVIPKGVELLYGKIKGKRVPL